jgi:iron(III) transport system ATP-binding protein
MNTSQALSVSGLTIRHGDVEAVSNVSFDVRLGQRLSLLGASGSGKSSILHAIAGGVVPTVGTITIGDKLVSGPGVNVPPEGRSVGMVFQEHALFPHLTVGENVSFGLTKGKRSTRRFGRGAAGEFGDVATQVNELLSLVKLPDFANRYVHELSGGERQRIAIARALAPRPSLLLLDEPFASLDRSLAEELRDELASILQHRQVTSILVTHDPGDALGLADSIAVLQDGKLIQTGSTEDIVNRPVDRSTAQLLGPVNVLTPTAAASLPGVVPGQLQWTEGPVVIARPADLRVQPLSVAESVAESVGSHESVVIKRTVLPGIFRLRVKHSTAGELLVDHPQAKGDFAVGTHVMISWT